MTLPKLAKGMIHWLLLVAVIVYAITGYGITEYRIVESLTFGLLTKSLAFKIHNSLLVPSVVLLVLHICLPYIVRLRKRKGSVPAPPIN